MEVSDTIAGIVDNGMFFGLAQQLARSYKKVYYCVPSWQRGFATVRDGAIGDGFPEVIHCDDIWKVKKELDVAIFPDIQHSGMQLELESQGIPVWGSREGDSIELLRGKFVKILKEAGLPVPTYTAVKGLTNLENHLREVEDKYVKISTWRGDVETFHHINYFLSRAQFENIAVRFGTLKEEVAFLVFDPIATDLETGYDGYNIRGWYPNTAIHGIEKKNQGYIGAVQPYDDLPEQVREVNERMSPILKKYRYTNFWSTEIRITPDSYKFIDPTCRAGNPSGDAQFLLYKNLAEIILAGAHGDVVEPEFTNKFVCQVLISHDNNPLNWRDIQVPESVTHYVRLFSPVKVKGGYGISPSSDTDRTIGSVLGEGKTIEEAISHVKANAEKIKDNPISVEVESLMDVLKEMHSAREQGVEMTHEKIPDPESMLEA
jgi:phosphoribosylamine-glycine ligase